MPKFTARSLFFHLVCALLGIGLALTRLPAADAVLAGVEAHLRAHPSGEAPNSWSRESYRQLTQGALADLPIGVFDSGIGGLTVLEALLTTDAFHNDTHAPGPDGRPDFEREQFLYLGDQANMPYGNYPSSGREDFLRELVLKDTLFLLGQRYHLRVPDGKLSLRTDKPPVKAIVIACNTATAYGFEAIKEALRGWNIPVLVVGVVEAGARGLAQSTSGGAVGVMATVGTCSSEVYPRTIARTFAGSGLPEPVVSQWGSARLAGVIEGDPAFDTPLAQQIAADVRSLVQSHQARLRASGAATQPIGRIMLGCTHYPLITSELDAAFAALRAEGGYEDWIAPQRVFINPAEWTARELFRELTTAQLHRPAAKAGQARFPREFFLSVANDSWPGVKVASPGVLDAGYKYQRSPGRLEAEDTVVVPMTRAILPEVSRRLLRERLPAVWRRLPES